MIFELDPGFDAQAALREFATRGRVHIHPFLAEDCALRLREHLCAREDWRLVLNAGEKVFEIDAPGREALSEAQRDELDKRVIAAAERGFQYRFETIRVADDQATRSSANDPLNAFASFLSSRAILDLLREISGCEAIDFADAQATRYLPGHFLTRHDDDVAGKERKVAYVFGLTPDWRAEWGGLLLFHDADGNIDHGFVPRMNALTLFSVPSPHSVSWVAPSAGEARLSITGWLRKGSSSGQVA